MRAIHGLGIAGMTTAALVGLSAPAFAESTTDAAVHPASAPAASSQAGTVGQASLLQGLPMNSAIPGALTAAGSLDPMGTFAFPKL
ncbi:hypothetical protein LQ327_14525 [Actinomycetospora endophytica]|uniref:GLTT repeat-containing protein n=1 Tax=Actinomycetospora endophytica TaxID=2291215 RepID=A0ABS8PAN5_9PSEU|nr:hypothetical protein [Actinomycetospora endophytica]MCD2194585.1 hypothetical protein [Actinomycetospora endophytica]